jgi:DedD protein
MSTEHSPVASSLTSESADAEQRGKISRHLMLAAGMVVVLLALLWFFDRLSRPPETPEAPQFTQPVPVPPKRPVIQPITPPLVPPETVPDESVTPDAPPSEPPAPPQVEAVPSLPPLAVISSTSTRPSVTTQVVTTSPARAQTSPMPVRRATPPAPPIVPEFTAPPEIILPPDPPSTDAPPANAPPTKTPSTRTGFLVQAGVFANLKRAEALRARLKQNGIPSTLETRVQLGPFETQADAEAARAKLRALGIKGILVPPPDKD